MSYYPICNKGHRYDPHFESLPEYQGTFSRHKCAGCAFELGYLHAISGIPKSKDDFVLKDLHYSQAGTVRHKDAFTAYNDGYQFALSQAVAA